MRIIPTLAANCAGPAEAGCWASGIASLDAALGGGLAGGRVHEVYAADADDAPAAAGFAGAVAMGMAGERAAVLWLRPQRAASRGGIVQAHGWAELGGAADRIVIGLVPDTLALLRAAIDALRGPATGAVIVEGWGALRELDLTASRRLALAAEASGVPLLLLRPEARPVPSAARTRWQVAAAPSRALPGNAPGHPVFDITLLRQRGGPCGLGWRLEWNRDQRAFQEPALSGAVVSVPVGGSAADRASRPADPNHRRIA